MYSVHHLPAWELGLRRASGAYSVHHLPPWVMGLRRASGVYSVHHLPAWEMGLRRASGVYRVNRYSCRDAALQRSRPLRRGPRLLLPLTSTLPPPAQQLLVCVLSREDSLSGHVVDMSRMCGLLWLPSCTKHCVLRFIHIVASIQPHIAAPVWTYPSLQALPSVDGRWDHFSFLAVAFSLATKRIHLKCCCSNHLCTSFWVDVCFISLESAESCGNCFPKRLHISFGLEGLG